MLQTCYDELSMFNLDPQLVADNYFASDVVFLLKCSYICRMCAE